MPNKSGMCWPERHQTETGEIDKVLTKIAKVHHPHVVWWWNQKLVDFHREAYCYICEKSLATWDSKYPMTVAAQKAVDAHRKQHIANLKGDKHNGSD